MRADFEGSEDVAESDYDHGGGVGPAGLPEDPTADAAPLHRMRSAMNSGAVGPANRYVNAHPGLPPRPPRQTAAQLLEPGPRMTFGKYTGMTSDQAWEEYPHYFFWGIQIN